MTATTARAEPGAQTKAEIRARALARRLEDSGWTVRVKVEHTEADHYSHGGVMLPAQVCVHVSADGPNPWDDMLGFSFQTWLPAPGHRSSTRYIGGRLYRRSGSHVKDKKLSLRELRSRIGSEAD
jgi:hypothetical protein